MAKSHLACFMREKPVHQSIAPPTLLDILLFVMNTSPALLHASPGVDIYD